MKILKNACKIAALLLLAVVKVNAQWLSTEESKMVNAKITPSGDLEITPSATSSQHDFDYLAGKWTMDNKRLKGRLNGSTEWIPYLSTDENLGQVLYGIGNLDFYRSSFNPANNGKLYEGLTLRLYNPQTRLWSLYWIDSNSGTMDPPVVGSFEGNIGRFYCKDTFRGKPILVMFYWDKSDKDNPLWYQAFSPDNGKTWEKNATNVSHKIK